MSVRGGRAAEGRGCGGGGKVELTTTYGSWMLCVVAKSQRCRKGHAGGGQPCLVEVRGGEYGGEIHSMCSNTSRCALIKHRTPLSTRPPGPPIPPPLLATLPSEQGRASQKELLMCNQTSPNFLTLSPALLASPLLATVPAEQGRAAAQNCVPVHHRSARGHPPGEGGCQGEERVRGGRSRGEGKRGKGGQGRKQGKERWEGNGSGETGWGKAKGLGKGGKEGRWPCGKIGGEEH